MGKNHRFGRLRLPLMGRAARLPRTGELVASLAGAVLAGSAIPASQGIWAEAGPWALAAAGALIAAVRPRRRGPSLPRGFLRREDVRKQLEQAEAGTSALILIELTVLARQSHKVTGDAGERALQEAKHRLATLLPPGAIATHWSEERFLVHLQQPVDALAVLALARDITTTLTSSPALADLDLACHAGIARSPGDGTRLDELVTAADLALAEARRRRTPGYGFHAPGMAAAAARRVQLQHALHTARGSGALRLDFQPLFAMDTGALTGFEALVRLHDPVLGMVPPSEFIPLAEEMGLISDISAWVLEEACRTAAQWPEHLVVSVNLSPADFQSGRLVTTIRSALQRNVLPAYRLEAEITEGTMMADGELVLGQLRLLRDMGVGVALDDFGTGYSSLSYLCRFPFSRLKIDRSFVAALDHTAAARRILESMVRLGHALGMSVTAEGIETQRQLGLLRDMGCDTAQGYLLGRPAAASALADIMLRSRTEHLTPPTRTVRRRAA